MSVLHRLDGHQQGAGCLHFAGNTSATAIAQSSTYYAITTEVAWALDAAAVNFALSESYKLQYLGGAPRLFVVTVAINVAALLPNHTIGIRVRRTRGGSTVTITSFAVHYHAVEIDLTRMALCSLGLNDTVWVEIANTTDADDLTVESCTLLASGA